jgi:hypothetical protein
VACEGKLWLDTNSEAVILSGVLLSPSFEVNLCSEGRLADKGLYIAKTSTIASIRDMRTQEEVISGSRDDGLYQLNCTIRQPGQYAALAATAKALPNVPLFHRRLGHPSMQATRQFLLSNAVIGLDRTVHTQELQRLAACFMCQKGKAARASFLKCNHRASAPCALIHSDLVGLFTVQSTGGAAYVFTFVDDNFGYGETIPIKQKSDVCVEMMALFACWQRQSGYQEKRLRSNRGTEYKGQVSEYLRSDGIVHETSTAYIPEENSSAERFKRTILKRVRCMLAEFNMPGMFWGEAVVYTAYCRSYMPLQGQTASPIELMFSVKPSIAHFRVFGCQAIRTVPRHERSKTDCPGEQCLLVGCAVNSKAWNLMRSKGGGHYEVVESIHCSFNEDVSGFEIMHRTDPQESAENDYQVVPNDNLTSPRDFDADNNEPLPQACEEKVQY